MSRPARQLVKDRDGPTAAAGKNTHPESSIASGRGRRWGHLSACPRHATCFGAMARLLDQRAILRTQVMHQSQAIASAVPVRVPAFCQRWSLDLTAGCEHGCLYCPFQRYQARILSRRHGGASVSRRLSLREYLGQDDFPAELLLSGHTDPCAPAAQAGLVRVLRHALPRGVCVEVVTKGIVPPRALELLAEADGRAALSIGVASLDARRNATLEPGCPPAAERLENLRRARSCGLDRLTARLDPLLPGVDDVPERLLPLLDEVARRGGRAVVASHLFVTSRTDRTRLGSSPLLGPASARCTEPSPVRGTRVLSVPLARKLEFHAWLRHECAARGLLFATCGCKDLRLARAGCAADCRPGRSGVHEPQLPGQEVDTT